MLHILKSKRLPFRLGVTLTSTSELQPEPDQSTSDRIHPVQDLYLILSIVPSRKPGEPVLLRPARFCSSMLRSAQCSCVNSIQAQHRSVRVQFVSSSPAASQLMRETFIFFHLFKLDSRVLAHDYMFLKMLPEVKSQ